MKIMFNKISSTTTKIKPSTLWNNQQTYPHISICDPWNSTFEGKAWNDFVSNIMFNVIKSLSNLIILKLSRFKIHNLNIDWLAWKKFQDWSTSKVKTYLINIHWFLFYFYKQHNNNNLKTKMHFHHNIKISGTYLKEGMQMYYCNINHAIMNGIAKNIQQPFEPIYNFFKTSWQTMNENLAKNFI